MKIGILTFHWATNYGAVLQCYALQSYLESMGHDVKVINYKPRQYDDNLYTFLRFRKFLNLEEYFNNRKKESVLRDSVVNIFIKQSGYITVKISLCLHHNLCYISGSVRYVIPPF